MFFVRLGLGSQFPLRDYKIKNYSKITNWPTPGLSWKVPKNYKIIPKIPKNYKKITRLVVFFWEGYFCGNSRTVQGGPHCNFWVIFQHFSKRKLGSQGWVIWVAFSEKNTRGNPEKQWKPWKKKTIVFLCAEPLSDRKTMTARETWQDSPLFLCPEIEQFSPHFGAIALQTYTGNVEKKEKIHWRDFIGEKLKGRSLKGSFDKACALACRFLCRSPPHPPPSPFFSRPQLGPLFVLKFVRSRALGRDVFNRFQNP